MVIETGAKRARERVLLIGRDVALHDARSLIAEFYAVSQAEDADEISDLLGKQDLDVVIVFVGAGEMAPAVLVPRVRKLAPEVPILLVADEVHEISGVDGTVRPDGLSDEHGRAAWLLTIARHVGARQRRREHDFHDGRPRSLVTPIDEFIIGNSDAMRHLRDEIEVASRNELNVLLTGETGVGKSLVAQAIHRASDPAGERPFIVIEPAALPSTLFEAEFFGHARGAFTDAVGSRAGAFEAARGGTIFLEEIGDLPMSLQVKLLGAVETKVIRRLGDAREIELDVRVVAATNRELERDIDAGTFRADFFQRLNEMRIHIPPLREHVDDVVALLLHFLAALTPDRKEPMRIDPDAEILLRNHPWPGNARELRTLARRLAHHGAEEAITEGVLLPMFPARIERGDESGLGPEERIVVYSRRVYLEELKKRDYSIRRAARTMGMPYATLHSRLKSLDLIRVLRERRES